VAGGGRRAKKAAGGAHGALVAASGVLAAGSGRVWCDRKRRYGRRCVSGARNFDRSFCTVFVGMLHRVKHGDSAAGARRNRGSGHAFMA